MQQEIESSRHIQNLIKTCLFIYHGNTNVERSLSDNKNVLTKEGTSLSEETLIGLPRCKQYSKNAGGAYQALVSKKIINKVKNAHLNHIIPNMQKKEEEESQKKQSNEVQEDQYRKKKELEEKERHVNLLGKRKKYEELNKETKKGVNNANISNLY